MTDPNEPSFFEAGRGKLCFYEYRHDPFFDAATKTKGLFSEIFLKNLKDKPAGFATKKEGCFQRASTLKRGLFSVSFRFRIFLDNAPFTLGNELAINLGTNGHLHQVVLNVSDDPRLRA